MIIAFVSAILCGLFFDEHQLVTNVAANSFSYVLLGATHCGGLTTTS